MIYYNMNILKNVTFGLVGGTYGATGFRYNRWRTNIGNCKCSIGYRRNGGSFDS